jgi:prepilin-type N-terminal cleavage/methylation domain-containing protein
MNIKTPLESLAGRRHRRGSTRGFTLIELMVVVIILSIVGTIAFAGLASDRFEGAYREHTEDVTGAIIRARHRAIDFQTNVEVRVQEDWVQVVEEDPITKEEVEYWSVRRDNLQGGVLSNDVCIIGFEVGVQSASQAADNDLADLESDCMGANTEVLRFGPDGTFELEGGDFLNGRGLTLVMADKRTSDVVYTLIQIFPGGNVRKWDKVRQP